MESTADAHTARVRRSNTQSSAYSTYSDSQLESISRQHCFTASTVTPVDAAGIRVLVVPIGPVRQGKLTRWSNALAQFSRIPIGDLLAHVDPSTASSYGTGMDIEGAVRLSFSVSAQDEYEYLEGLQTHRQVLGVIGILDCALCEDVTAAYDQFCQVLSRHTTAVAYRCLAFDPQDDQLDDVPGVTMIPNVGASLLFYLQTQMNDFAGTMVSALTLMAKSIEDRTELLSPVDPGGGYVENDNISITSSMYSDHRDDRMSLHETSSIAAQTMTSRLSQVVASRESMQSGVEPASPDIAGRGRHGGELDRQSVLAPSAASAGGLSPLIASGSGLSLNTARQKRNDGSAANTGRLKKLQGDLYLMAGRLPDAFSAYTTSVEASRTVSDYLWQATALEGYCAALLMLCERTADRKLLHAFLSCAPRTTLKENAVARTGGGTVPLGASSSGKAARGAGGRAEDGEGSLASALTQIGDLFCQVPLLYEHSYSFAPLLHMEACIRQALVLCATRESHLGDPESALLALLRTNSLQYGSENKLSQTTSDVVSGVKNVPLRATINEWLERGWSSSFAQLSVGDQLGASSEISHLFHSIGYSRKSSFFLRQFLLLAVPILLRSSSSAAQKAAGRDRRSGSMPGTSARNSMTGRHEQVASSAFADGSSAFAAVAAAAAAAVTSTVARPSFSPSPSASSVGTPGAGAKGLFDFYATNDSAVITREWFTKPKVDLRQAVVACLDILIHSFDGQQEMASHSGRYGWLYLQTDIVRECLSIAEALPSYPHAISAAFRLVTCLSELTEIVPEAQLHGIREEQHTLKNYLQRTITLYHQRYHFDPAHNGESPEHDAELLAENAQVRTAGRDASVVGSTLHHLLSGIQLCTFPGAAQPIKTAIDPEAGREKTLFLHNPSAQMQGDVPPLLVANERAHFVATLQNPFPFALELNDVALVVRAKPGDRVQMGIPVRCVVPAHGSGQVLLEFTPEAAGEVHAVGIQASLFQHLSVQCLLADEREADAKRRAKEKPLRQRLLAERNKLLGITGTPGDAELAAEAVQLSAMNAGHTLLAHVAPALPSLQLLGSSVAREESLSLLEGESCEVRFTLVNGGSVPIDSVDVRFEPLTLNGKRVVDDAHAETQQGDVVNAALSYRFKNNTSDDDKDGSSSICVGSRQVCTLLVKAVGLNGCVGGDVVVRYAGSKNADWYRELRWPLRITVARLLAPAQVISNSLAAKYLDMPPYIARTLSSTSNKLPAVPTAKFVEDIVGVLRETQTGALAPQDSFYLAEANIRNDIATSIDLEIEVDLSPTTHDDPLALLTGARKDVMLVKTIHMHIPGHRKLARLLLPLPRVRLSDKVLQAPIPGVEAEAQADDSVAYPWHCGLTEHLDDGGAWSKGSTSGSGKDRQFVLKRVARGDSNNVVAHRRRLFWYQQEICSRIRIRWKSNQSGRSGYMDPRPLFALESQYLGTVQRSSFQTQLFVGEQQAAYVGRLVSEVSCPAEAQSFVRFVLVNDLDRELNLQISARAAGSRSRAYSPGDDLDDELAMGASDAMHYPAQGVQLLSAATISTAFAAHLPKQEESKDQKFRFTMPLAPQPPSAAPAMPSGSLSAPDMPEGASASPAMVFDNVHCMKLPPIAPGSLHQITLPVYVVHPGQHKIEYELVDDALATHVVEHGLLIINGHKD